MKRLIKYILDKLEDKRCGACIAYNINCIDWCKRNKR